MSKLQEAIAEAYKYKTAAFEYQKRLNTVQEMHHIYFREVVNANKGIRILKKKVETRDKRIKELEEANRLLLGMLPKNTTQPSAKDLADIAFDKILEEIKVEPVIVDTFPQPYNGDQCMWDNIRPEDRNKPMGICCPCKKCSIWC